ncbi:MAG TPA: DUF6064 family protein [Geminicoccaceae bacterium]|nr:DUF6064 family protein [Geminicoccaceae bacterium]
MLPYTAEVLFASIAQYNRALWPLPPVALILCLVAILLTLRPVRGGNRAIGALLAAAWLWTGIGWHLLYFAHLNFAAPLYGAFFVLQGLLLAWTMARGKRRFRFDGGRFAWVGLLLAITAVAWPLIDRAFGMSWLSERVVGLEPVPTTILTFGLLLLMRGRTPLHLAIVPLLWTLVAGVTAWILWIPQDLVLPVIGLGGFGLLAWKNQRRAHRAARQDDMSKDRRAHRESC